MKTAIGCALLVILVAFTHATPTGGMFFGEMYDVKDGTILNFEIKAQAQSGPMRAYNPTTGERLEGPFTITSHQDGTTSDFKGIMFGDRGTIIEVSLETNSVMLPSGVGIAKDNAGRQYQIQIFRDRLLLQRSTPQRWWIQLRSLGTTSRSAPTR